MNASPSASCTHVAEGEKLYHVDPNDGVTRELWPPNPRAQLLALAPGEARLFQVGGQGQGKNF